MFLHLLEICFYICWRYVFTFVGDMFLHLLEICFYICWRYVFTFVGDMFLHLLEICFYICGVPVPKSLAPLECTS